MKTSTTWKPIKGYEDRYLISTEGQIKNLNRSAIRSDGRKYCQKQITLKSWIGRGGYPSVKLTEASGKCSSQYIHCLLARTFIPQPFGKNIVNHKNGHKEDFSLDNLEWVTRSENHLHALRMGLCKMPGQNKRKITDNCRGLVFQSMTEAAQFYKVNYTLFKNIMNFKKNVFPCLSVSN